MTSKYPNIKDKNFYDEINRIYKKYKIVKDKGNIDTFCRPKKFKLQIPQKFVSEFMKPDTPYKGILIYHRIGAGKTCSSIQIAEKFKTKKKIIFVLPAALKGGLRNELRTLCGGNNYLTAKERNILAKYRPNDKEYKEIINKSNMRIDKYYNILSYNKFIELCQEESINLNNCLLIIDEIQNMVSECGTYYNELYNIIKNSRNLRIVLLSATPMFDRPVEIALTLNLLDLPEEIPTGKLFNKTFINEKIKGDKKYYSTKNLDKFKKLIKGYVSYYRGAPPYTYPKMKVKYVSCEMSDFQYNVYKKVMESESNKTNSIKSQNIINVVELPNNFYLGTRFVSNIVFPNKLTNEKGFESFIGSKITKNLEKYSCKFYNIMNKIKRTKGKVFIYSAFKEFAGLKSMVKVLEEFGYKNYREHGIGRKRFAVWSGDENTEVKDEIREIYNHTSNLNGKDIKIILGSPSIKEGVSLKAVKTVHIIEPYWNKSRMEQIMGRASRFCSHKDLPAKERHVKVYIYIATHPEVEQTVDEYIRNLSENKNKINKKFELSIKEAAIDCRLNHNANSYDDESDIDCA